MTSFWPFVLCCSLLLLIQKGEALYCHRCMSAMGGCGEWVHLWMFPWKGCGDSNFCVKVIEKHGSDVNIIRDCESNLQKYTQHRLRMPILRRHGYCLNARKNDPSNPEETEDPNIQYCFCHDFNGCNSGNILRAQLLPLVSMATITLFLVGKLF